MSELLIPSLNIEHFRTFRRVQLERLGRINLIVGKNNVGKTTLLEALWIYARRGVPSVLWEQLAVREERGAPSANGDIGYLLAALSNVFFGRSDPLRPVGQFTVGIAVDSSTTLAVSIEELAAKTPEILSETPLSALYYRIRLGESTKWLTEIHPNLPDTTFLSNLLDLPHSYVAANGMQSTYIARLWDKIALTDLEEDVLTALQLIAPEVERVNMLSDPKISSVRTAMVRMRGSNRPLSLRSYGDGMNRLFSIALALVNAKDGLLFVDEIENGIHYSVLLEMWHLIIDMATKLNVQIFATTHSGDCVNAFQAATRHHQDQGMLIRLGRRKGEVVATLYDEEELEIAIDQQVEVR